MIAEQLCRVADQGKKYYVLDFLTSKGFILDADTVINMIEKAVLEINKDTL